MVRRQFSTGLQGFDEYLGGLFGGDTVLSLISHPKQIHEIYRSAIQYSIASRIPVVYVSTTGSLRPAIGQDVKKITEYPFHSKKQINALKRFVSAKAAGSYILLDELSLWKELLGKEERVVELFQDLTAICSRKNAVVFSAALRSEFSHEHLAGMKDSATVCLDFVTLRNETYCVPLSLKGRYLPSSLLPLKFDIRNLQKSKRPEELPPQEPVVLGQQESVLDTLTALLQPDYEKTFRFAGEAMVLFDIRGDKIIANERCEQLFGYSSTDWNPRNLINAVSQEKKFAALRFVASLKKKQRKAVLIVPVIAKNGKTITAEFSVFHVSDTVYFGVLRDVSEQFRLVSAYQQREEEYRTVLDRMQIGIMIAYNNSIVYSNNALRTMLGYPGANELHAVSVRNIFSPDAIRKLQKMQRDPNAGHESFESHIATTTGATLAVRISVSEIQFQKKNCFQLSIFDISKQKEILDVLNSSEKRFRTMAETTAEAGAIIRDQKIVYSNKAFADLLHVEQQQAAVGTDIAFLIEEPNRSKFLEKLHKRTSKSTTIVYEGIVHRNDETDFDGEFVFVPMSEQDIGDHILFLHDRTEQKKISAELHQQSEEMELLRRVIPALQGSIDFQKLPHTALNSLMDVLSWNMGAIYLADDKFVTLRLTHQKNFSEASGEKLSLFDMNEGIGGYCAKTLEPHIFRIEKYPAFLPHRRLFKDAGIQELCLLPLVSNDVLEGIVILASKKDLLDRKHSPALLSAIGNNLGSTLANARMLYQMKETDRFRNLLIESSPDVLYSALPSGGFVHVNARMERLVGYAPKEFYRDPALWLKLIHLEDKRIILERTTNLHQLGHQVVNEYRVLPRGKASYRWVRDVVSISKNNHGDVVHLYGTITDITDQKNLLDRLQHDQALHAGILDELRDGVVAVDRSMKCIFWNGAMERLSGIDRQTAIGSAVTTLLPVEEEISVDRLLANVLEGEIRTSAPIRYRQTGAERYFIGNFSPMHNQHGEIIGAVGTVIDISSQKHLETKMRESEQTLNNVIDTMGDVLLITDLEGKVLEVNRTFLRVLGYSRPDVVTREFPYPWLVDEEMGKYVEWIANLRERNWLHDFDMTWRTNDGRLIPMSVNTTLLRNSLGEPIAMLNTARDITERVRLSKDLADRNKQIEMVNRIISKANQTTDFDEIVNIIVREIRGFLDADLVAIEIFHPDRQSLRSYVVAGKLTYFKNESVPVDHSATQFVVPSGQPLIVSDLRSESRFRNLSGVFKDVRSQIIIPVNVQERMIGTITIGSNEPYFFSEEHIQLFEPMAHHIGSITDRINLINQVTEDSTYIHTLLDSIDSVVFTVDMQMCLREVNTAWYSFMKELGYTGKKNVPGLNLFDVVPDEQLKMVYRDAVNHLTGDSIRMVSQEFGHRMPSGDRTYHLVINPMMIDAKVAGLVFTQTNITELKETEADLKRSHEQLIILNEISTSISTSFEIQQVLQEALVLLRRMTKSDGAIVYLTEENSEELVLVNQIGFDIVSFPSILRLKREQSVTGDVVTGQKGIYIEDHVVDDERVNSQNRIVLNSHSMRAMAVVPLLAKDKILGALDIFYATRHEFSERERQVLTLVGNQLGVAVESAQLYGELRSQIDRLTLLNDFSQKLTSTLDLEQIFRITYDHVQQVIPFTTFSIDLYDELSKMKTPAFSVEGGVYHPVFVAVSGKPVPLDPASIEGNVVIGKVAYYSEDRKTICIPMMSKQMIIGILTMTSVEPMKYGDTHRQLLESVGNLTAIALEKGQLYEETLQKSSEIERRNKELDDFTYVVSHDLKEPLISIEGFSRILQSDYNDIIQQEGREYFESIVGATTRMKGLIDDLLLLSRVSRPSESFKNIFVKQILDDITTDMEFTIKQKKVNFIIPDNLPVVYGNETQLKIVFRNLIGNAVKFNDKAEPSIEIGFHNTENNSYLFFVRDNGIGIDREFYEKIFVIFQRLHRREQYEGSGAGLAIVKKIIESHKGSIWVESEIGKGSTFFFTIPKSLVTES